MKNEKKRSVKIKMRLDIINVCSHGKIFKSLIYLMFD